MQPAPFLAMADLAKLFGVHPRTARRWAAADHWRRTVTRPVRYSLADAQASHDKRHGSGRVMRHLVRRYAAQLTPSPWTSLTRCDIIRPYSGPTCPREGRHG